MHLSHEQFRELAWKHGMAATHQRKIIFEAVVAAPGHYSPEQIYAVVKRRVPSVSLATIYKNLRVFVENGLLREVTPHAPALRVDGNLQSHHHLVCTRCNESRIGACLRAQSRARRSCALSAWVGRCGRTEELPGWRFRQSQR